MDRVRSYVVSAAVMLGLDLVWLGLLAPPLYQSQVGQLLRAQPDLVAATLFYALYLVGVNEFVVHAERGASVRRVALRGALFGLVAYATFDLTALALIRGWTVLVTVVDLAWGATLTAVVAPAAARSLPRR
ncbi:MAG: DUF2177 family protein [bacterium]